MLPDDLNGKDAIELGCGTAYVSSWFARRGARVVAIDNSSAQLATARRLQRQNGFDFELIHGNAESVAYPDASFDFAISEYGVCLWAVPYRWVPEAARLMRAGGRLVFLANSFLMTLCTPTLPPQIDSYAPRRVPSVARRLDSAIQSLGIRDRRSDRGAAVAWSDDRLSVRDA
jgi:ubiquinone/menaquinone biosynthesis C-methylase UbiE